MRAVLAEAASRLREVTGANAEPAKFAASWAVGIAIGLSPLIGAQTVLAILVALCCRLNKVDVLLGTLVVNPWTLTFYFPASVVLGRLMTGAPTTHIGLPRPADLLDFSVWQDPEPWIRSLLFAWSVGATTFALLGGVATYVIFYRAVRRRSQPPVPSDSQ